MFLKMTVNVVDDIKTRPMQVCCEQGYLSVERIFEFTDLNLLFDTMYNLYCSIVSLHFSRHLQWIGQLASKAETKGK